MSALQGHSSKHGRTETLGVETDTRSTIPDWEAKRLDVQSNDVIEVVAPPGGGISEVTSFPDAAAGLAGTAGVLMEPDRSFCAADRHRSSRESDVAVFARRVEIPVIGRDGEIAGVLCRNSPLTSESRSIPLTQDQDAATIGEATKTIRRRNSGANDAAPCIQTGRR